MQKRDRKQEIDFNFTNIIILIKNSILIHTPRLYCKIAKDNNNNMQRKNIKLLLLFTIVIRSITLTIFLFISFIIMTECMNEWMNRMKIKRNTYDTWHTLPMFYILYFLFLFLLFVSLWIFNFLFVTHSLIYFPSHHYLR